MFEPNEAFFLSFLFALFHLGELSSSSSSSSFSSLSLALSLKSILLAAEEEPKLSRRVLREIDGGGVDY